MPDHDAKPTPEFTASGAGAKQINQHTRRPDLKNKPLVEAMVEVRWALTGTPPGPQTDPNYRLLLGRLFDRVSDDYPEYVQLPTANMPDEIVGHMVQHQFRVGREQWPLIQLGPGIMTLNSTSEYTWDDFRPRAVSAIDKLHDAHPKPTEVQFTNLFLRYIDAVEFDYNNEDVFPFLRDMLKVNASLPESLYQSAPVEPHPLQFAWQSSFRCQNPKGAVHLNFATGQKLGNAAVIWETTIQSTGEDVPSLPDAFAQWSDAAHGITDDWFFTLISGELERRFSRE